MQPVLTASGQLRKVSNQIPFAPSAGQPETAGKRRQRGRDRPPHDLPGRPFQAGLSLFMLGSWLAPAAPGIITSTFTSPAERARAIGV